MSIHNKNTTLKAKTRLNTNTLTQTTNEAYISLIDIVGLASHSTHHRSFLS